MDSDSRHPPRDAATGGIEDGARDASEPCSGLSLCQLGRIGDAASWAWESTGGLTDAAGATARAIAGAAQRVTWLTPFPIVLPGQGGDYVSFLRNVPGGVWDFASETGVGVYRLGAMLVAREGDAWSALARGDAGRFLELQTGADIVRAVVTSPGAIVRAAGAILGGYVELVDTFATGDPAAAGNALGRLAPDVAIAVLTTGAGRAALTPRSIAFADEAAEAARLGARTGRASEGLAAGWFRPGEPPRLPWTLESGREFNWRDVNLADGPGRRDINCTRCVIAADRTWVGGPSMALPIYDVVAEAPSMQRSIVARQLGRDPRAWRVVTGQADIERRVLSWGPRGKGIVAIEGVTTRADRLEMLRAAFPEDVAQRVVDAGPGRGLERALATIEDPQQREFARIVMRENLGHVVNVRNQGGRVVYADPQFPAATPRALDGPIVKLWLLRTGDVPPG